MKSENLLRQININGPRKVALSMQEIKCIHAKAPLKVKFYFLDGQMKPIDIHPVMQVSELIKELSKQIGLKESPGWGLYEQTENDATKGLCTVLRIRLI